MHCAKITCFQLPGAEQNVDTLFIIYNNENVYKNASTLLRGMPCRLGDNITEVNKMLLIDVDNVTRVLFTDTVTTLVFDADF
jgi:hypothetical protein